MKCDKCGAENKKRAEFCVDCGAKLEHLGKTTACSQCGRVVSTKHQFCPFCGADIWQGHEMQHKKSAEKRKFGGGKIVLILGLLILAVVGVFFWGIMKYSAARMEIDEAREMAETARENSALSEPEEDNDEQEAEEAEEEEEYTDEDYDSFYEDLFSSGYSDGVYEVGVDIPEGIYFLAYNDADTYEYCKFHNAPSESLLGKDEYQSTFYIFDVVYIADGDFIEIELCNAIPYEEVDWMIEYEVFLIDDSYYDEGGYIVGDMIPAGTYEVVSQASSGNDNEYVIQVWDSIEQRRLELRGEAEASTDNVYYLSAGDSMTITIKEGQYIYFDTMKLIPKNLSIMLPIINLSAS